MKSILSELWFERTKGFLKIRENHGWNASTLLSLRLLIVVLFLNFLSWILLVIFVLIAVLLFSLHRFLLFYFFSVLHILIFEFFVLFIHEWKVNFFFLKKKNYENESTKERLSQKIENMKTDYNQLVVSYCYINRHLVA